MLLVYAKSVKGFDHIENEDSFLVDEKNGIFAVADGVSIPPGGGIASKLFLEFLQEDVKSSLKDSFLRANKKLVEERNKFPVGYTTASVVLIKNEKAEIASVGDSPIYLVRNKNIEVVNEIDRTFDNTLIQAVGNEEITVHTRTIKLKEGDYLLLMTDGIADTVPSHRILEIVEKNKEPKKIAEELIKEAESMDAIYSDDKTVVVVKYGKT